MSGDWRQVGPVVKFATPSEVVEHAFLSSHLWKHVVRLRLTKSMRDKDDIPYAKTVLAIGEGAIEPIELDDGTPVIPLSHTVTNEDGTQQVCTIKGITDFEQLVQSIYPDLLSVDHRAYKDRGILAPTNDNIDNINNYILKKMPGQNNKLLSSDRIVTDDVHMPDVVSVEYLNEVNVPGTPPHEPNLKLGCLIFFIRNINFDSGLVNGRKGIVRGISQHVLDIEVLAEGSPLVKVPRICFEVQVGSRGITFHRIQYPVKVCYATTINKAQGNTLKLVGLDLRGDVFCHGQLYVAVSRATSRDNAVCLVQPERLIDGVPHVHNVTYPEFVQAATGKPPPVFTNSRRNKQGQGNNSKNDSDSDSGSEKDSQENDQQDNDDDDYNDNQYAGQWAIIPEIGDGACLLRCISRNVYNTPEMHDMVRAQIMTHISNNLHNPIPGTGGQTYHQSIAVGINQEQVQVAGSAPVTYSSVENYISFQSQTYAYATHVELVAAQAIYGREFRVTIQGSPYPQPPADSNVADFLFDPSAHHYSTLSFTNT